MILVKNSNFLHCLFLLKIGPEMMFGDVQKIGNLQKGLTHNFGQKF